MSYFGPLCTPGEASKEDVWHNHDTGQDVGTFHLNHQVQPQKFEAP